MAVMQSALCSSPINSIQNRHQPHHASEKSSAWQPLPSQAQSQSYQPLPPLLQRPRFCSPVPSKLTTSPSTSEHNTSPSTPQSRAKESSAMAIDVLRLMDSLRFPIEVDTYASLLRDCARSSDFLQGTAVHSHIRRRSSAGRSLLRQPAMIGLANRLLLMYAFCGQAMDARQLFEDMPLRDSISRIIIMTAFTEGNEDPEALRLFLSMHAGNEDWWAANPIGFRVVLWACTRAGELGLGQLLHGLVVKLTGCLSFTDHSTPLIYFYAKLGRPDLSLQLMMTAPPSSDAEELPWPSIVSAYCKDGCFRKALMVFKEMERRRSRRRVGNYKKSNRKRCRILASIIAACTAKGGYEEGHQVHAHAVKVGADEDGYVGCSLVELYSKRGILVDARRAFETVREQGRDSACWNAMLSGYTRGGSDEEKLRFLHEMKEAGIKPHESILNQVW